jgi:large subunit ribosomal protein L1
MKKPSKRYAEASAKVDKTKNYSSEEAINLAKATKSAKFDETVDLAFKLGVDPRHADQMIRGALALPAGTGRTVRVVAITSGTKVDEATAAGADFAGGDDIITKIAGGWLDFDRVIASPDMMSKLGKVARLLGPRGLMPNPKLGTVTTDVAGAVKEQKAGKVEYRTEKTGIIHVPIGKTSFTVEQLKANYAAVVGAIVKAKPASAKGAYIRSLTLSTTMGPGIKIDTVEAFNIV